VTERPGPGQTCWSFGQRHSPMKAHAGARLTDGDVRNALGHGLDSPEAIIAHCHSTPASRVQRMTQTPMLTVLMDGVSASAVQALTDRLNAYADDSYRQDMAAVGGPKVALEPGAPPRLRTINSYP
jgi:hypothetical protein